MNDLMVGQEAPLFCLLNQFNEYVSIDDFKGKSNIVLYFYPRASTPGCTVQACGIRDNIKTFNDMGVEVLAISPDSVDKIQKFVNKQDLNFSLLSDEEHKVAERYNVWGLKKFMGRESMGVIRSTFIINKKGILVYKIPKFTTKNHHEVVLDFLKSNPDL